MITTPNDHHNAMNNNQVVHSTSSLSVDIGVQYLANHYSLPISAIKVTSSYTDRLTNISHIYVAQVKNGFEIMNAVGHIHVDLGGGEENSVEGKEGIVSFGGSLIPGREITSLSSSGYRNHQQYSFTSTSGDSDDYEFADSRIRIRDDLNYGPVEALVAFLTVFTGSQEILTSSTANNMRIESEMMSHNQDHHNRNEYPAKGIIANTPFVMNAMNSALATGQVPFQLAYISHVNEDNEPVLELVWDFKIEMEKNWLHTHISTSSGRILSLIDWVSQLKTDKSTSKHRNNLPRLPVTQDTEYKVFEFGKTNSPLDGKRSIVRNPSYPLASPLGWHDQGQECFVCSTNPGDKKIRKQQDLFWQTVGGRGGKFHSTVGNNIYAHENWIGRTVYRRGGNQRPDNDDLKFVYDVNFKASPKSYVNASVVNSFYWSNVLHDLFYVYGFDESAGNFQMNNFEHAGQPYDPVIVNVQDGSGWDNANFATPPDGIPGRMRLYLWDDPPSPPFRDGSLEADIIQHEYSHGLSNRLTGGPANTGCLGWGEPGGLGEGWGDFIATILRVREHHDRFIEFGMGDYAGSVDTGIRAYKYSTSMKTNPHTYSFINRKGYWSVHAKGEVWAVMLWECFWNVVEVFGFDGDWFMGAARGLGHDNDDVVLPVPSSGNQMLLKIVIEAMKYQPCNPNFIDARDTIFLTLNILFKKRVLARLENESDKMVFACLLWKGFAKRGLGFDAKDGVDSFVVPGGCR